MPDKLSPYRQKRSAARTPEPVPSETAQQRAREGEPMFVVQEHHARALHWDFRLERDGVLVSWAVPKGVPVDPRRNHLAVRVDDHELEHGRYQDERVTIWDRGTYLTEKWTDREVKVVLRGQRVQ